MWCLCRFSTFSQKPVGDPQVWAGRGEDAPGLKPPCSLLSGCKTSREKDRFINHFSHVLVRGWTNEHLPFHFNFHRDISFPFSLQTNYRISDCCEQLVLLSMILLSWKRFSGAHGRSFDSSTAVTPVYFTLTTLQAFQMLNNHSHVYSAKRHTSSKPGLVFLGRSQ